MLLNPPRVGLLVAPRPPRPGTARQQHEHCEVKDSQMRMTCGGAELGHVECRGGGGGA